MYLRGSTLKPSRLATAFVVVDECRKSLFKGRIYHPYTGENSAFSCAVDLLNKLEGIYNRWDFPQHTHTMRSFHPIKVKQNRSDDITREKSYDAEVSGRMEDKVQNLKQNGKTTFILKVLYRQNATWQGNIQWVEGNKTRNFRSDLEMLKLMDDAVRMSDEGEDDTVKWE